jgi:hypothetical protein
MRLIALGLFFLLSGSQFRSSAQAIAEIGENCTLSNSIIFGKVILESIGEKSLKQLIENNEKVLVSLKIDRLGEVKKIEMIRGYKYDTTLLKLNLLKTNQFKICYVEDRDINIKLIREEIKKEFKVNKLIWIPLFFPGPLEIEYTRNKTEISESDYILERLKE